MQVHVVGRKPDAMNAGADAGTVREWQHVLSQHDVPVVRQYNDITKLPAALQTACQPVTAQVCHCSPNVHSLLRVPLHL